MPWYTLTDSFDADFGVDEWHGHNVFIRDGGRVFRTYFTNWRGDEAMRTVWSFLDITPLADKRIGKIRRKATRKRRRTLGGTGMTVTTTKRLEIRARRDPK
jgi:predicted dithiol-disulfide oxidoreductase (DUF899 family)